MNATVRTDSLGTAVRVKSRTEQLLEASDLAFAREEAEVALVAPVRDVEQRQVQGQSYREAHIQQQLDQQPQLG